MINYSQNISRTKEYIIAWRIKLRLLMLFVHLFHLSCVSEHPSAIPSLWVSLPTAPCLSALLSQGGVRGGSSPYTYTFWVCSSRWVGDKPSTQNPSPAWRPATSLNRLWRNDEAEKLEKASLRGKKCTWRGYYHTYFLNLAEETHAWRLLNSAH